jgi:hypothetical protein
MSKPPDEKLPIDRTKYAGPQGAAASGAGVPETLEEEWNWLRRAEEAEERDKQREQARAALIRLGQERDAAREANDLERAETLTREKERLAIEIEERFGY